MNNGNAGPQGRGCVRSGRTTTDDSARRSGPPQSAGQRDAGELRFAPNFSVYVLPPDRVCLYAENRKVFLAGELYCALAARIGAGERRDAVVAALSREFPIDAINEAITRLRDRRLAISVDPVNAAAAGYWASLGLAAETAAENLSKISVQIEAKSASGHAELHDALRKFGVRVVDHAADLAIVAVDDYLDRRLADLNRQRLAQKQPWLLVQPSGIFPLVGPIFSPGKSACWTCLADRLKWNRQIKAFLDRTEARCVAASPLGDAVMAPSAIGLAATEIAKAVASGFRTDLHHHVVSLDLLGSAIVRHYVSVRPQCPSCGNAELRNPKRVAAPIRLRVGGKTVMTGDGCRSEPPAETIVRFRKHVSPLTGIVSQLERIKGEQPLDFSFHARHSFAPRPDVIDAPRVRLIGDCYGKGSTVEQGEASALMKAVERTCGIFHGDEIRTTRRFADFPAGDAIPPNDILLFGDAQHKREGASRAGADGPRQFDPSAEMEWTPVWSLRDERFKHLPTGLLYYFHDAATDNMLTADSNGCAAGNTIEEAILQGFLELVERDACAIWWYNRLQRAEIDLDRLGDRYILDLRTQFAAMGRSLWLLDVTSDLGIPVTVAVLHWKEDGRERVAFAAGAHLDPRIAALRAATELNQCLAVERIRRGAAAGEGPSDPTPTPLRENPYLRPQGKAPIRRAWSSKFADLDRREQILACVKLARRFGLDVLVLDQTRPDLQVPVVRVIAPGLRPFDRRFAPGRLYDVPVDLGLRKRPLREAELNRLEPRAFGLR
jgi:bacteriocin biosynthesis cyclodehydratase domain-containing protein